MDEQHINEIIGRIKSTSIETRLSAILEAKTLFNGFFAGIETLAEWANKAVLVETIYNLIREELRQPHVRIGHKHDETADVKVKDSKEPKTKESKPRKPKTEVNVDAMVSEFQKRLEAKMGGKTNE